MPRCRRGLCRGHVRQVSGVAEVRCRPRRSPSTPAPVQGRHDPFSMLPSKQCSSLGQRHVGDGNPRPSKPALWGSGRFCHQGVLSEGLTYPGVSKRKPRPLPSDLSSEPKPLRVQPCPTVPGSRLPCAGVRRAWQSAGPSRRPWPSPQGRPSFLLINILSSSRADACGTGTFCSSSYCIGPGVDDLPPTSRDERELGVILISTGSSCPLDRLASRLIIETDVSHTAAF